MLGVIWLKDNVMSWIIRNANPSDINAVFQLEHALFGSDAYPRFFLRQAYDCWPKGLLVAVLDEKVVGYVLASPRFASNSHEVRDAWLLGVAVDTVAQGKGIGKALVQEALQRLADHQHIWLTVHPDNKAMLLYQALGFDVVEQEDNYFGDDAPRVKMRFTRNR